MSFYEDENDYREEVYGNSFEYSKMLQEEDEDGLTIDEIEDRRNQSKLKEADDEMLAASYHY